MLYAPERFDIRPQTVIDNLGSKTKSYCPVGLEDIMPTVLEMAGVDIPDTVDGKSLLLLMQGKEVAWRPYIQIECGGNFQCLTNGREKFVWFTDDGSEQFFDLVEDLPREIGKRMRDGQQEGFILRGEQECRNLITAPERAERIAIRRSRLCQFHRYWLLFAWWRSRLVDEIKDRKEGFSSGERLIPRPKAG